MLLQILGVVLVLALVFTLFIRPGATIAIVLALAWSARRSSLAGTMSSRRVRNAPPTWRCSSRARRLSRT